MVASLIRDKNLHGTLCSGVWPGELSRSSRTPPLDHSYHPLLANHCCKRKRKEILFSSRKSLVSCGEYPPFQLESKSGCGLLIRQVCSSLPHGTAADVNAPAIAHTHQLNSLVPPLGVDPKVFRHHIKTALSGGRRLGLAEGIGVQSKERTAYVN